MGIVFVGCAKEIKREIVDVKYSQDTQSCHTGIPAMCYTCGPGLDGNLKCKVKLSMNCSIPGKQFIEVKTSTVLITYEDFSKKEIKIEEIVHKEKCK